MKKVKTSFTISGKTLKSLDRLVGKGGNRSAFVEEALNAAIQQRERELRDERDIAIYNAHADEIQREIDADTELIATLQLEDLARRRKERRR